MKCTLESSENIHAFYKGLYTSYFMSTTFLHTLQIITYQVKKNFKSYLYFLGEESGA